MNRTALMLLMLLATPAGARADTLLVGDFFPPGEDGLSVGLPYLVARSINSSGGCRALLFKVPPAALLKRLYDARGEPRPVEAARLCRMAGADRFILGRYDRKAPSEDAPERLSTVFYIGNASGGPHAVFRSAATGENAAVLLAARAAVKACPTTGGPSPLSPRGGSVAALSRALWLFRKGDLAGANVEARAMRGIFPKSADAHYLSGAIAAKRGKPYSALRFFTASQNLDDRFALPAYAEGKVWLSLKRSSLADKAFAHAARIHPLFFEAVLERGIIKASNEDYGGARPLLENARELRPGNIDARYWMARNLAGEGQHGKALRIINKLIAEEPRHGPSRLLRGRIYFENGTIGMAARELRAATSLMPGNGDAHELLGQCLSKQSDHEGAALEFKKALRLQVKK